MNQPSPRAICPGTQPFIRNNWYVIAFSHEVEKGKAISRKCMDEPIVLFREENGDVTALFDRCPHRGVPLSQGKVLEKTIECPYHGFQFDHSGRCVVIPSQESIPRAAHTHSYPVVEQMQFVWVWMGDPEKADPSQIPDYTQIGCDNTNSEINWEFHPYFMMEIKANYSLLFENLLDTSHISFLQYRRTRCRKNGVDAIYSEH